MDYTSFAIADREARWFKSCNSRSAQVIESIRESGVTQREFRIVSKSSPVLLSHLGRAFGVPIKGRAYVNKRPLSTQTLERSACKPVSGPNPVRGETLVPE
jgi:hypothetical protein